MLVEVGSAESTGFHVEFRSGGWRGEDFNLKAA